MQPHLRGWGKQILTQDLSHGSSGHESITSKLCWSTRTRVLFHGHQVFPKAHFTQRLMPRPSATLMSSPQELLREGRGSKTCSRNTKAPRLQHSTCGSLENIITKHTLNSVCCRTKPLMNHFGTFGGMDVFFVSLGRQCILEIITSNPDPF
jgi:hypothetical protein